MTTTVATSATVAAISASTTSTAIASHLGQLRVDLLLGFLQNIHKVPSLFGVCR